MSWGRETKQQRRNRAQWNPEKRLNFNANIVLGYDRRSSRNHLPYNILQIVVDRSLGYRSRTTNTLDADPSFRVFHASCYMERSTIERKDGRKAEIKSKHTADHRQRNSCIVSCRPTSRSREINRTLKHTFRGGIKFVVIVSPGGPSPTHVIKTFQRLEINFLFTSAPKRFSLPPLIDSISDMKSIDLRRFFLSRDYRWVREIIMFVFNWISLLLRIDSLSR